MKFGRLYSMTVQGRTAIHSIQFPLTARFRIVNNSLFTCGHAVIQVYNLGSDVRSDIYKDAFEILTYRAVQLAAGYQNAPLPILFQGNILQAFSYRQGPDWITEIQALDGGFAVDTAQINLTKPAPWSFEDTMKSVVATMATVRFGKIGSFSVPNARGITYSGNSWDLITQRVAPLNAQAFIHRETVYIINQAEYLQIEGTLDRISEETGLIGTPRLQEALVKATMIFEPQLEVAQAVELETLETRMNGTYKVLSVSHNGTISGAVCETALTEATLYQPDRLTPVS